MRKLLAAIILVTSLPIGPATATSPDAFVRCAALDLNALFVGGPATLGFAVPNDVPRTIGIATDTSGLSAVAAEKLAAAVKSAVLVWSVVPERFSLTYTSVDRADVTFDTRNAQVPNGVSVTSTTDGQWTASAQVHVDPNLISAQEPALRRQVRYGLAAGLGLGKIAPNTYESVLVIDGESSIETPTPFDVQLLRQLYGAPLCSWSETQSAWSAVAQDVKTLQTQASQLQNSQKSASGSSVTAAKRLAASKAKLAAAQKANAMAAAKLNRICAARPRPKGC